MRLFVTYDSPEALITDAESQFAKGGLLVRGDPPPGILLFQDVELAIAFDGRVVVVNGQVVQMFTGTGVAVAFTSTPELDALVADAKKPLSSRATQPASRLNTFTRQINQALHGTKDERMAIIRDVNKQLHPYVLRNSNLGLDEVLTIAKMSTIAPELLKQIADRKEWAQRQDIAIALVRNPKTPVPTAVKLLDHVSAMELRQLAKDARTKPQIQAAARKKVLGG